MDKHAVKGIGGRRNKKEELQRMINIVKLQQGTFEAPKARKERAKETKPREQPERELRENVIRELRRAGVKVMRVENSIVGKHNTGISDLIVFNLKNGVGGFMELKSSIGDLTGHQPEFQEACKACNINYWVVRSVEEAKEVVL